MLTPETEMKMQMLYWKETVLVLINLKFVNWLWPNSSPALDIFSIDLFFDAGDMELDPARFRDSAITKKVFKPQNDSSEVTAVVVNKFTLAITASVGIFVLHVLKTMEEVGFIPMYTNQPNNGHWAMEVLRYALL